MPLHAPKHPSRKMTWDLFCRVVDNHGDAGVCWRLATDLASRGVAVRLWIDDDRALAWMAPTGRAGVEVRPWPAADGDVACAATTPAAVVIETFGCGLPDPYLQLMADASRQPARPLWINLEYLTAEPYAERSHGLPSLQNAGPGRGLTSWFFYPGFTLRTGGLLREIDLLQRQAAFDADRKAAWLARHGIAPRPAERLVSLFCYRNTQLPGLLRALASQPTLLLTTPGHATEQVVQAMAATGPDAIARGRLRTQALPWLTQVDYDHLLWSCDLNFVRGEDSLVRAIWAGRPFVWQIYPQEDGAHATKLSAFLASAWAAADPPLRLAANRLVWHWNGWGGAPDSPPASPETGPWDVLNSPAALSAWGDRCVSWRAELREQPDLTTQLMTFATARMSAEDAKI